MSLRYVSLHNHSTFSMYDGLGFPEQFYQYVIQNGGDGFALTEHGSMNSLGYAVAAAKQLKAKGVNFRPIFGVEAYYHPSLDDWRAAYNQEDSDNDTVIENEQESKERKWYDPIKRRHHLVLFALNRTGLENLFSLVSLSYRRENFYRFPRIDNAMLRQFNDGIGMSTACLAGLPTWLSLQNPEAADEEVMQSFDAELLPLLEIFGRDRAFLELQFNALPEQAIANKNLIRYANRSGYKLIVASDAHYCRPDLWREREIYKSLGRQMMGAGVDVDKIPKSVEDLKCELYPHNAEQIYGAYQKYFSHEHPDDQIIRDAINRTHDIAWHLIDHVEPDSSLKLPKFVPISNDIKTPFDQLKRYCIDALKERGLDKDPVYVQRTIYELQIIKDKNIAEYFLTKKAILDVLRKRLLLGTGRGSGAGSIVNYLLRITSADPIKGGLLFERFISPSRAELPDIDSDCEDKDQAFEILKEHFGEDDTLAISNYNTLKLKSLVKDVARLYSVPFEDVNNVTRVMEEEARDPIMESIGHDQKLYDFTYENAYKHSPTFRDFIDARPEVGECLAKLYRAVKSIGRHAGGVLIVPEAHKHLPIVRVRNVAQSPFTEGMTAQHLKHFGLVKFDVLGLTTLKIIRRCIELILKNQFGRPATIEEVWEFYNSKLHPDVIDPADSEVFKKVYHEGRFPSIFQFAEPKVQAFCQKAKPQNVNDLAAITAIFRPGPLKGQADKRYIESKQTPPRYDHPIFEEVLGDTKGLLCIEENQLITLANYTRKPIKDVCPGDTVITGEHNTATVAKLINSGLKQCVTLTTSGPEDANTLTCTPDHKLRTSEGYIPAQECTHVLRLRYQRRGPTQTIKHPYLLGMCVGDGCLNQSSPAICCGTEELARVIADELQGAFGRRTSYSHHLRAWYVRCIRNDGEYLSPFSSWLASYNLKWKSKAAKRTPIILLNAPDDDICEYLAGYLDSDGRVSEREFRFSCAYSEGRILLCKLLDILRISFAVYQHHILIKDNERFADLVYARSRLKKGIRVPRNFAGLLELTRSDLGDLIDYNRGCESRSWFKWAIGLGQSLGQRKKTRLSTLSKIDIFRGENFVEDLLRGDFSIDVIRTKEDAGVKQCFDLTIDHPNHSFIANHIAVHNCYQEQFMLLANKMAGFSLDEADKLRKLLVKPSHELGEEMKQQRIAAGEHFIRGCIEKGLTEKRARDLWHNEIAGWCSYGFNKSHAYVYAYNSYQCAWLYTHHEQEWIKACLEKDPDLDRMVKVVTSLGYEIQRPDINFSLADEWQVRGNVCIPPLVAVKGIGNTAAQELIRVRDGLEYGFTDLENFFWEVDENGLQRWRWSKFNKKAMDALMQTEGFGSLPDISRFANYRHMHTAVLANFDLLRKGFVKEGRGKKAVSTNITIDQILGEPTDDWSRSEKIQRQKELLGVFDPRLLFSSKALTLIDKYGIRPYSEAADVPSPHWFVVKSVDKKTTRTGKPYRSLKISDEQGGNHSVNYFQDEPRQILCEEIYAGKMHRENQWLNITGKILPLN